MLFLPPEGLTNRGINLAFPASPELAGRYFTTEPVRNTTSQMRKNMVLKLVLHSIFEWVTGSKVGGLQMEEIGCKC